MFTTEYVNRANIDHNDSEVDFSLYIIAGIIVILIVIFFLIFIIFIIRKRQKEKSVIEEEQKNINLTEKSLESQSSLEVDHSILDQNTEPVELQKDTLVQNQYLQQTIQQGQPNDTQLQQQINPQQIPQESSFYKCEICNSTILDQNRCPYCGWLKKL
jgi:cell division protein FtsN